MYRNMNDQCTYCVRRGFSCGEKMLGPQHQKQSEENQNHQATVESSSWPSLWEREPERLDIPSIPISLRNHSPGAAESQPWWFNQYLTRVSSAIHLANESISKAGEAINNLFNSLKLSLPADLNDPAIHYRYLAEFLYEHFNSLDLKTHWSNFSGVWSKFISNVGRMIPSMQKVTGHDGFLGNYPIHTT